MFVVEPKEPRMGGKPFLKGANIRNVGAVSGTWFWSISKKISFPAKNRQQYSFSIISSREPGKTWGPVLTDFEEIILQVLCKKF